MPVVTASPCIAFILFFLVDMSLSVDSSDICNKYNDTILSKLICFFFYQMQRQLVIASVKSEAEFDPSEEVYYSIMFKIVYASDVLRFIRCTCVLDCNSCLIPRPSISKGGLICIVHTCDLYSLYIHVH